MLKKLRIVIIRDDIFTIKISVSKNTRVQVKMTKRNMSLGITKISLRKIHFAKLVAILPNI